VLKGNYHMKRDQDHFRGCLLGGAVGDALGAPVEFLRYNQIIRKYGQEGIHDLETNSEGLALFTDDTQMTLFTAEGILRAYTRGNVKGICRPPAVVYNAYKRWLVTQGYPKVSEFAYDGWLLGVSELHASRGPGSTCLSALLSRKAGTIETPINNSKGCGGVMRVAPAGLAFTGDKVFSMGAEFAALTHGHPSGYLSAGTLAQIIFNLIDGSETGGCGCGGHAGIAKAQGPRRMQHLPAQGDQPGGQWVARPAGDHENW
jgi:ADP-ribosylglycohydrolase